MGIRGLCLDCVFANTPARVATPWGHPEIASDNTPVRAGTVPQVHLPSMDLPVVLRHLRAIERDLYELRGALLGGQPETARAAYTAHDSVEALIQQLEIDAVVHGLSVDPRLARPSPAIQVPRVGPDGAITAADEAPRALE